MDLLEVAHVACDAATRTIGTSRPARSDISHKSDGSIVTELDRRAETVTSLLRRSWSRRPGAGGRTAPGAVV